MASLVRLLRLANEHASQGGASRSRCALGVTGKMMNLVHAVKKVCKKRVQNSAITAYRRILNFKWFSHETRRSVVQVDHLVRVEDVERVERALDRAHRAQRARAVLPLEVRLLADADAVLAGAGAAARDGALEQTVVDGVPGWMVSGEFGAFEGRLAPGPAVASRMRPLPNRSS